MADKRQFETSKIDALYSWISYDLQKMKGELLNELKYSAVQVSALHKELKQNEEKSALSSAQSAQAISQEIRYSYKQNQTIYEGIATMLGDGIGAELAKVKESVAVLDGLNADTLAEIVKAKVEEILPQLDEAVGEVKYSYLQHQAIYDGLTALISGEVIGKLNDVEAKLALVEQLDKALEEINARVAEGIALFEDADYKAVIQSVSEKTEESVTQE